MKISELFGILLSCFQQANPKVIIKTPFSPHDQRLLSVLIEQYQTSKADPILTNLAKLYLKLLADSDNQAYQKARKQVSRSPLVPPTIRNTILNKHSQLDFRTPAVPGPARLCRVPFYPLRNENAWSSRINNIDTTTPSAQAFGIEELGDDPIISIGPWLSTNDTTQAGPYTLVTRKIEFGAYRLIGLEIAAHYGSRFIGNITAATAATGTVTFQEAPAAVAATAVFTVNTAGAGTSVGINIRVTTIGGLDETVTSANPVINPNDFLVGANESITATNLATILNAFGGITAAALANVVTVTMNQVGTIENGQIATSSNESITRGISAPATGTFTGGSDNVSPESTVTLEDAAGITQTFTAKRAAAGSPEFTIDQVTSPNTATNLANAINTDPTGIAITANAVGLVVNLTQDVTGVAGRTTIATTFPLGGVVGYTAAGFAGGGDPALDLVNDLSPIALALQELVVYNGDNILSIEDSESVSIGDFNILNRPETFQYSYNYGGGFTLTPTGQAAATLSPFKGDASYKFIGLRDQPIVDPNSQVFVKVSGFVANVPTAGAGYPANTPLPKIPPVSLSINLVVDLLGDKIFGDPLVPSPASRAAANIKLAQRKVGPNKILVTNTVTKKP